MTDINKALLDRDYTVMVDQSGSMDAPVGDGSNQSRWDNVKESTVAVTRKILEFEPEGITLYTFSNGFARFNRVDASKVESVFATNQPMGSTALHRVLHDGFKSYFDRRDKGQAKSGGESFFVVTDGMPDDKQAVVNEIVAATKRVNNPKELSVTFLQVGDDAAASDFLHKLDDELTPAGAKYDIVDTIPFSKMAGRSLTDIITAAITEHRQSL